MRRSPVAVIALLMGLALSAARAEEPPVKSEDFPAMIERVGASSAAQAAYRACPAEVWDTARPFWRKAWDRLVGPPRMKESACDADPLSCLSTCLGWRNGGACFQSARTLQEHAGRDQHASFQALFAQACALGYPAGCTNRAAGILNGDYEGDPIPDPKEPKMATCLTRSFSIACDGDDPWGCAMHGMALRFGDGVAVDPVKARAAFEKSCELSPKFAACATAKSQLEEMDETKEGAADLNAPVAPGR